MTQEPQQLCNLLVAVASLPRRQQKAEDTEAWLPRAGQETTKRVSEESRKTAL